MFGAISIAPQALAVDRHSLEARLDLLERTIDSQVNVDLLNQVAALQEQVQMLQGRLEEQQHEMALLNKRQESLFKNLDDRLDKLALTEKKTLN